MNVRTYKQELLDNLYAPYKNCVACPLGKMGRTHVVFGEGNPDARLMFIGEGPGKDEDAQGRPFVGRSGKLLNKVLELAGTKRENVFIANVVKCRPPNNRKPLENEISICTSLFLFNQIKIVRPSIICTLGASALQALFNNYSLKISQERGKPRTSTLFPHTLILPTFHPAYILRNPKELQTMYNDIHKAITLIKKNE